MSGLFGGGHSQSVTPQRYNGIQISSSASGGCVPLLYGMQRLSFNLIWYGAFVSTPNSSGSGGKGGGGSQTTSYTYKASFAAALCEGPINAIVNVWLDKDLTSLAKLGFTLFTGAGGQATWSYLTTNFSAQAIPYDHICYVGAQNYVLGNSASLPNITFETRSFGTLPGTFTLTLTSGLAIGATSATLTSAVLAAGIWNITFSDYEVRSCTVSGTSVVWTGGLNNAVTTLAYAGGAYDADPSFIISDYLTDANHGVGFPSASVATLTGANSYQSYCLALGLTLSPLETTQRGASDFIKEILQITNSDSVWSAGTLRIAPYCDSPVAGNGVTFTPDLTPEFIFTDDDFLDIPELTRVPIADTYNHVRVEYLDRSNAYNTAVAEATDLGNIAQTGERVMSTLSFHGITNSTAARVVAQLALQTSLYERNTIKFKVRADYSLLEPMDYIGITDVTLGYVGQVFRITKITDDDKDEIEIEAMEILGTVRTAAIYDWQAVQGYNANFAIAPGHVQAPAFLEAYGVIISPTGGRELWITVGGPSSSAAWGGCNIFMSFDNVTYTEVGIVSGAGRYGTISSAVTAVTTVPDVTTTMSVALNNTLDVLGTGSAADAQDNRMLIAVGSGATVEIMSYETATLVSAGNYNLTTIYRGLYNTSSQTHAIGAQFMRLDGNVLALTIDPGWLGKTVYFKFCSFNNVGRATEDLSTVTAYPYTLGQSVVAYNAVSSSTFSASGSCVMYSPTTAFKMTTGAAAWDSTVYSAQSYVNGCTAECYPSQALTTNSAFMMGLTVNPLASNSYTNLAYAWYLPNAADVNGALQIYEGGTFIGTFGTYTTSDLFAIVYDGKHIAYYHNAVLVRSVPIANQTFFMQMAFLSPGAAAYGISFDSMTSSPTTFTLKPLTNNVACVGNRAAGNNQGANAVFGIRCFQSAESYNNGCVISFSIGAGTGAQMLGFSNSPSVATYVTEMTAGWYPHGDSTVSHVLFNGNLVASVAGAPLLTDVYTITYDNFTFRWWFNGALIHQEYFPNAGALFVWGDGFYTSSSFKNISFEPYGQLSPNPFKTYGGCDTHDSTARKGSGANAWDSGIYSLNAYNTCHAQWKMLAPASHIIMGLGTDPLAAPLSSAQDSYCWYANGGNWFMYELGATSGGSFGAVQTTDLAVVTYDGSTINYLLNDVSMRTVSAPGLIFYLTSVFFEVGVSAGSISFGPGAVPDTIPTASIDNSAVVTAKIGSNAVSQIISNYNAAGVTAVYPSSTTPALTNLISVSITTTGFPIAIDAMCNALMEFTISYTLNLAQLVILRDGTQLSNVLWDGTNYSGATVLGNIPVTITLTDTVAAGAHTYTLAAKLAGTNHATGNFDVVTTQLFIKVREIKK